MYEAGYSHPKAFRKCSERSPACCHQNILEDKIRKRFETEITCRKAAKADFIQPFYESRSKATNL